MIPLLVFLSKLLKPDFQLVADSEGIADLLDNQSPHASDIIPERIRGLAVNNITNLLKVKGV